MITKEYMDNLQKRYVNAQTDEERDQVRDEMHRICSNEDAEVIGEIALAQMREANAECEAILVRQQLEAVLPFISLASIAKTYFNKSRVWLYQRVNGLSVNGKPAEFTKEEKERLTFALHDIGKKLESIQVS
jgi:hypothetical protein